MTRMNKSLEMIPGMHTKSVKDENERMILIKYYKGTSSIFVTTYNKLKNEVYGYVTDKRCWEHLNLAEIENNGFEIDKDFKIRKFRDIKD
ncbi:MAG: hypothetical protein KAQ94_06580 [Arcobacteraceae bacterium]|nr:hypothetical protein [Arcobacteraceae bacterium]